MIEGSHFRYGSQAPQDMSRAFRFQVGFAPSEPPSTYTLDRFVAISQGEDSVMRAYALKYALRTAREHAPDSEPQRLLYAANIMSNLAWRPGSHLTSITQVAERLTLPDLPVVIRETMAEAVKNASWHEGQHIDASVSLAVKDHVDSTPRMRYSFVKVIGAAARHSLEAVQVPGVRRFLELESVDESPIIARRAQKVFAKIFDN